MRSASAEAALNRTQLDELVAAAGFDLWGISAPQIADQSPRRHLKWLQRGHQGDMAYLERRPLERYDAASLLPECRSVLVLGLSYYCSQPRACAGPGKVSRYAWGDDYHDVLGQKLRQLAQEMRQLDPGLQFKACVDTSPLAEKAFAIQAGLGWPGRNSLVLNPRLGSYFFIALLLLSVELEPDQPLVQDCGSCTMCIRACPTEALSGPGILNAVRCVSYLTTERRGPVQHGEELNGWLYGCDTCQEVCPFNSDLSETGEARLQPRPSIRDLDAAAALALDEAAFEELVSANVIRRRRLDRLRAQASSVLASDQAGHADQA